MILIEMSELARPEEIAGRTDIPVRFCRERFDMLVGFPRCCRESLMVSRGWR
jgi:hypothetical protein